MIILSQNRNILWLIPFVILSIGCSGKRYTSQDGIPIFSQSTNIDVSPNLLYVDVEPQQVNIDECMLTNDFDPQKAHLSMLSYPDIDEEQYDSKFKRTGKLDFYLHPIMCDGKIFDITNTAKVIEYNLNNGKVEKVNSFNTLKFLERSSNDVAFARLDKDNNVIYIATKSGYVIAFDANAKDDDKKILWKKQYSSGFMASPSLYDGKLFLISTTDEIYAINTSNGEIAWKIDKEESLGEESKKSLQTPPVLIYQDKIIAGLSNGSILKVDAKSGIIDWKMKVLSSSMSSNIADIFDIDFPPVIFADRVLVAGGINTSVMGFDLTTGRPLWQIPASLNSYMMKNNQGFGFFVDGHNNNICFNGLTGEVKAIKSNGSKIMSKPIPSYMIGGHSNVYTWRVNRYYDAYFEE